MFPADDVWYEFLNKEEWSSNEFPVKRITIIQPAYEKGHVEVKKKTTTNQLWNQKPAPFSHENKSQEVEACLELKILVELKLVLLKWL